MTPEHPKPDPLAELREWYRSNCAGWDDVEDIEAELDREPLDDEGDA